MIFVSGTKRSGTSMWMQILMAAGVPILGKAFPRRWGQGKLRAANEGGFYETLLRQGVYYRTNPHPVTGSYFLPEDVAGYAVKVFIPGVVRSERGYISHLVANLRAWREYEASILRLYALEDAQRAEDGAGEPPFRFPPAFEWWMENFALIRDISLRRYPARLFTYDEIVRVPDRVLPPALAWLGGDLSITETKIEQAIAAVRPERRTQQVNRDETPAASHAYTVDDACARVFDDLYAEVAARRGISGPLLKRLNETNRRLLPTLVELQKKVARASLRRGAKVPPIEIAGLPAVGSSPGVLLTDRPARPEPET